jgi:hypothetical protein
MTLERLGPWRLPVLAGLSVAIALALVGLILLLGRAPTAVDGSPSPSPTEAHTPRPSPDDGPEAAVRAFFEAFAEARETGDPELIEPYANGTRSSAYQTAAGFLGGQSAVGKASIVTVNELTNFEVDERGDRAVVYFDHRLGGYDIDLETGEPLETPVVLPVQRKMVELVRVEGSWLVDSFENVQ